MYLLFRKFLCLYLALACPLLLSSPAKADQTPSTPNNIQRLSTTTTGAANELQSTTSQTQGTSPPSTGRNFNGNNDNGNYRSQDNQSPQQHLNNYLPPAAIAVSGCLPTTLPICGTSVSLPAAPLGYATSLTVPPPYLSQAFTVQCLSNGISAGYVITDASAVSCALVPCMDQNVRICGRDITVPGGTSVGSSIKMNVPVSYLAAPSPFVHPAFTVQCAYTGGNEPIYQLTDASGVSCNLFSCPSTQLKVCGASVPIEGGLALGERIDLNAPPPYVPDPFVVQCLGSEGKAPVYQITDSSALTCGLLPH